MFMLSDAIIPRTTVFVLHFDTRVVVVSSCRSGRYIAAEIADGDTTANMHLLLVHAKFFLVVKIFPCEVEVEVGVEVEVEVVEGGIRVLLAAVDAVAWLTGHDRVAALHSVTNLGTSIAETDALSSWRWRSSTVGGPGESHRPVHQTLHRRCGGGKERKTEREDGYIGDRVRPRCLLLSIAEWVLY
ncbi:uncharacterized protein H6S33_001024 [Morchella sextelata]|uniref:uncharacterized protein n=1 Tax=Morchella sextelata TaxID=1174677 RepID=UPI001D03FD41|nr:uncharacterized protein H6S33_001024 [Morchella sextelata]KAH0608796.1 hypothetical protein H6S33_001024 [Morchella sextelata]